ncbi:hypothetical protein [Kozakia baliensis]|uniref:hypothetical protein n=1 Tax=Kozakia baliensis TaxID=153496 RepID=UPI00087CC07E|nr:hypothetical protein [Kozakia baliensis]AOX21556.1 hypothetical protein A0U90_13755 [Kozakia baliensis]
MTLFSIHVPTKIIRLYGLLGNALTLRAILGREPRTLEAYFEELRGTRRLIASGRLPVADAG